MFIRSRRDFMKDTLRSVTALGALGQHGEVRRDERARRHPAPYQALVCIFLAGGNDGHNTVVPITTAQQNYSLYAAGTAGPGICRRRRCCRFANGSDTYGLHPSLPEIQALYNQGKAAVLANVGMLVQPTTTRALPEQQPGAAPVPAVLPLRPDQPVADRHSHRHGSTGWGGRVEDNLLPQYNAAPAFSPITATTGCGLFCTGQQTFAATVPVGGASLLIGATTHIAPRGGAAVADLRQRPASWCRRPTPTSTAASASRTTLNAALATAKINTVVSQLARSAQQLQTVAKVMSVRNALGIGRQVFFCQLGGFDTHGAQVGHAGSAAAAVEPGGRRVLHGAAGSGHGHRTR